MSEHITIKSTKNPKITKTSTKIEGDKKRAKKGTIAQDIKPTKPKKN